MARLERLPFECYVLRGALDARERAWATESVARYASREAWARAAANDHPTIVASHARGQRERAMACVRACGLKRCTGACGGDVGALSEAPIDLFELSARVVATAKTKDDDDGALRRAFANDDPFEASHFWALVYGEAASGDGKRRETMAPHLDRGVGWVVSISLGGRPTRMTIGKPPARGSMYDAYAQSRPVEGQDLGVEIVVNDGDAVIFRGDRVFHSVDGFAGEPVVGHDEWARALVGANGVDGYGVGRLALLFRDERETQSKAVRY